MRIPPSLPVLDPNAAAIDVGSESMHCSIAGDRPEVFGTTTGQLYALRDWLLEQGVRSVAMESTGVYWLCIYEVLEKAGRLEAALVGNWKAEHLFALRQAHDLWNYYQSKIGECDAAIEKELEEMSGPEDPEKPAPKSAKKGGVNSPAIANLHGLLWRLCGCKDATKLPGVADYVLLQLIAEVGLELGKHWRRREQFTAWTGLAPGSKQSGKRWCNQKRRLNRAGRLFALIARSVGHSSDCALAGFYRRIKGRGGGLAANKALARKLACLYYDLMVHGTEYVEVGLKKYQEKVAKTEQALLRKLAKKHNMKLTAQTA